MNIPKLRCVWNVAVTHRDLNRAVYDSDHDSNA